MRQNGRKNGVKGVSRIIPSEADARKSYKSHIALFLKTVLNSTSKDVEQMWRVYWRKKRDYKMDVIRFFNEIKDNPPKSVASQLSCVRTMLIENGVSLPEAFWRRLRQRYPSSKALTQDRIPTKDELQKILANLDLPYRALALCLLSSGARVGEMTKIKLCDVDFKSNPTTIQLRGEYCKNGVGRVVFISSEAKKELQLWLEVRKNKGEDKDDRVFPFPPINFWKAWRKALTETNLDFKDESTNRLVLHIHTLRKYFRTYAGKIIYRDALEALLGHEGYLSSSYLRLSVEDLRKEYLKLENSGTLHFWGEHGRS